MLEAADLCILFHAPLGLEILAVTYITRNQSYNKYNEQIKRSHHKKLKMCLSWSHLGRESVLEYLSVSTKKVRHDKGHRSPAGNFGVMYGTERGHMSAYSQVRH